MKDQIQALKAFLQPQLANRVEALFEEFVAQHAEAATINGFLDELRRRDEIGTDTFCRIHTLAAIEVSGVEDFEQTLSGAAGDADAGTAGAGTHVSLGSIGSGAMGEVLLVKDRFLRRKVAYKKLLAGLRNDRRKTWRFVTEAQITAQLDHPNIVPIYGLEKCDEQSLGYSMKLIRGQTFKELIAKAREGVVPAEETRALAERLELFLKVCDAMSYAHSRQVLHRDLKPANIMVGSFNEVYVVDWGIAKRIGEPEQLAAEDGEPLESAGEDSLEITRVGEVIGTPAYMSPEQAHGKNDQLDARSDQYSLGAILFELCSLQRAFSAENTTTMLYRVMTGKVGPLEHINSQIRIPRELKGIIKRAMALKPELRYGSVTELADDIRRYQRGLAVQAAPDTPLQAALRFLALHRVASLATTLVLVLLLVGWGGYSHLRHKRATEELRHKQTEIAGHKRQALERARHMRVERKLAKFLASASRQAHRIERFLLQIEALLEGLASVSGQVLSNPRTPLPTPYLSRNFNTAGPKDLKRSAHYFGRVSLGWPSVSPGPGVFGEALKKSVGPLLGLRRLFKSAMVRSVVRGDSKPDDARILAKGVPIAWIFFGLKDGSHVLYPGSGGIPEGYDARTRPWYKLARSGQRRWGNPYIDTMGAGLVLPCAEPIISVDGKRLGVVSIAVEFGYIIEHLMKVLELGEHRSYILDRSGRIVVQSGDHTMHRHSRKVYRQGTRKQHDSVTRKMFPIPAVVRRVKERRFGYLEVQKSDASTAVGIFPLVSQGLVYVVTTSL